MLLAQLSFLLFVSLRCTSGWHHFESSIGKGPNASVPCSIATHCFCLGSSFEGYYCKLGYSHIFSMSLPGHTLLSEHSLCVVTSPTVITGSCKPLC